MKTRIFLAIVISFTSIFPANSYAASSRNIPSNLRETSALDSELIGLERECKSSQTLLKQLRNTTRSTRTDVERAIKVTSSIRSVDKRMTKLIDRLKPYLSIPKVRTVAKTLRNNLLRVQKQVRRVRKKTDRVESSLLKPIRQKLVRLEGKVRTAESKVGQVRSATLQSRSQLAQLARIAANTRQTQQALEASSRQVRPPTRKVTNTINSVNADVRSAVGSLSQFRGLFGSFRTVDSSLAKFSRDLKPGEKVAGDIDRVLSKRLEIRLPVPPFKKVGFSVRQILETPGKVIGVVLKPLEKLADKALQPALRKMKLEIKAPAGLASLERSVDNMNAMSRQLTSKLDQLEAKLTGRLLRDAEQFQSTADRQLSRLANQKASVAPTKSTRRAPVVFFGG